MRAEPVSDGSVDLASGTVVAGKYIIEQKLGEGGMGAVYAAHHHDLGIRVAIKVLLPSVAKDPQVVARFLQEARAAARVEGDHIARVSDVDTLDSGLPFMVMELLAGEDSRWGLTASIGRLPVKASSGTRNDQRMN